MVGGEGHTAGSPSLAHTVGGHLRVLEPLVGGEGHTAGSPSVGHTVGGHLPVLKPLPGGEKHTVGSPSVGHTVGGDLSVLEPLVGGEGHTAGSPSVGHTVGGHLRVLEPLVLAAVTRLLSAPTLSSSLLRRALGLYRRLNLASHPDALTKLLNALALLLQRASPSGIEGGALHGMAQGGGPHVMPQRGASADSSSSPVRIASALRAAIDSGMFMYIM